MATEPKKMTQPTKVAADPIAVKRAEVTTAEAAAEQARSTYAEKESHRIAMAHKDLDAQSEASGRVLQAATSDAEIARSRASLAQDRLTATRAELETLLRAEHTELYRIAIEQCSQEGVIKRSAALVAKAFAAKVELEGLDADLTKQLADAWRARDRAIELGHEIGVTTPIPSPVREWVGFEIAHAIATLPSRWPPSANYIEAVVTNNHGKTAPAEEVKAAS